MRGREPLKVPLWVRGFLEFDRFVLAAGGDDADHGPVALAGGVAVGVLEDEEEFFADVGEFGGFEVFLVSDDEVCGGEEGGTRGEGGGGAVGAGLVVVGGGEGVVAEGVEDENAGGGLFGSVVEEFGGVVGDGGEDLAETAAGDGAVGGDFTGALRAAEKEGDLADEASFEEGGVADFVE